MNLAAVEDKLAARHASRLGLKKPKARSALPTPGFLADALLAELVKREPLQAWGIAGPLSATLDVNSPTQAPFNFGSIGSASLVAYHNAGLGLTYNSSLYDFGVTQPAVTLSGTLGPYAVAPGALYVPIDSTGTKYNVSLNSGHDFLYAPPGIAIPAGSTAAIPGTLLVLNFAAGPYVANGGYISQSESFADQSGNGFTLSREPTGLGCMLQVWGRASGVFGHPYRGVMGKMAGSVNAQSQLKNTGALASTLFGGTNKSFSVYWVGCIDNLGSPGGLQILFGGSKSTAGFPYRVLGQQGTGPAWQSASNNDTNTGTGATAVGGTPVASRWNVYAWDYDAGTQTLELRIDGNIAATHTGTPVGAATGLNVYAMFGFFVSNVLLDKAKATWGAHLCYSAKLSAPDDALVQTELRKLFNNLTIPKHNNITAVGDSDFAASQGEQSAINVALWSNDNVTVHNRATSGWTMANLIADAAATDATLDGTAAHNQLWINIGNNDIQLNGLGNEPALEANLASYITARRAAGWDQIFVSTLILQSDGAGGPTPALQASKKATFNAWLLTGASGATAVTDYASTWPTTDPFNLFWYASDALHPSPQGASRIADVIQALYVIFR